MARHKIAHGATIETATPTEVAEIIAAQLDARDVVDYTRRKGIIKLSATGTGLAGEQTSPQYDWRCERVTIGGPGAVNALVQFFENQSTSTADLLEVIQVGAAGLYSDGFSNNLYVPANSTLLIVVTGGVAGLDLSYNVQIKQLRRRPIR